MSAHSPCRGESLSTCCALSADGAVVGGDCVCARTKAFPIKTAAVIVRRCDLSMSKIVRWRANAAQARALVGVHIFRSLPQQIPRRCQCKKVHRDVPGLALGGVSE